MVLPFVLIFVVVLSFVIKNNNRKEKQLTEEFWEKERQANSTRKKNIEHLDYITIPLNDLPFFENLDKDLTFYQNEVKRISESPILNLTGFSNTDLKLEYGVGNFTKLSEYDENYTKLVSALARWGERLISLGYEKEGIQVLEFGIDCKTDVSSNYITLAKIYSQLPATEAAPKLKKLSDTAANLNSMTRETILNRLKEFSHEC